MKQHITHQTLPHKEDDNNNNVKIKKHSYSDGAGFCKATSGDGVAFSHEDQHQDKYNHAHWSKDAACRWKFFLKFGQDNVKHTFMII